MCNIDCVNQLGMFVLAGAGGRARGADQGWVSLRSPVCYVLLAFLSASMGLLGPCAGFFAHLPSVRTWLTIEIVALSVLSSVMFNTELGVIGSLSVLVVVVLFYVQWIT